MADELLGKYYNELRNLISNDPGEIIILKEIQNNWIQHGRDARAKQLINKGMHPYEAYTQATTERANSILSEINSIKGNTNNSSLLKENNLNEDNDYNKEKHNLNIGIYNFFLGMTFDDALSMCINNGFYVNVTSSNIPNKFNKYINNDVDTRTSINGQIDYEIVNKHDGKYINNMKRFDIINKLFYNHGNMFEKLYYIFLIVNNKNDINQILNKIGLNNVYDKIHNKEIATAVKILSDKYLDSDINRIKLEIKGNKITLYFFNNPKNNKNELFYIHFITQNNNDIKNSINDIIQKRYGTEKYFTIDNFGLLSKLDFKYIDVNKNYILYFNGVDNVYFFYNPEIIVNLINYLNKIGSDFEEKDIKRQLDGI